LAEATPAFKSIVAIHLAEALYEVDDIDEARGLLETYAQPVREFGRSDELIISHILQARIAQADGDLDSAFLRLSELECLARRERLPRAFATSQLERARMALCVNDMDAAQQHLDRACERDVWRSLKGMTMPANDVENIDMCRHRIDVRAISVKDEWLAALSSEVKSAQANRRNRQAVRLNLLLAKLLHTSGQQRLAMRTLEGVLRTAKGEGMIRAFVDEGAPIIELVRAFRLARQTGTDMSADAQLIAFADKILQRAGIDLEGDAPPGAETSSVPTLTARELQTLDALAKGLSNIKIAERLFVSETTVRSHLRKISAKLGTSSRTQAVCVARNFGLI
jgi:LuxR family transcriptional regulator, maltose regulon positive regulatory protein